MNTDIESGLKRMQEVWEEYRGSSLGRPGPDFEAIHFYLDKIILEYLPDCISKKYNDIEKMAGGFVHA